MGGDFNAHVGRNKTRQGIGGKFGLRTTNQQGNKLLEWCEANSLAYVNSFSNHRSRGTWFSNFTRRWYELDGFLMKNRERQRHVKKVVTVGEMAISDHKPKKMTLYLKKKKWRNAYQGRKVPLIKWEELRCEDTANAFRRKMGEKMGEVESGGGDVRLG